METELFRESNEYYKSKIAEFGADARGLNWKDEQAQLIRFEQLVKIIGDPAPFTINDVGCGFGDLYPFLQTGKFPVSLYRGYDISAEVIGVARERFREQPGCSFYLSGNGQEIVTSDYTVASGIFNLKFNSSPEDWLQYILKNLEQLFGSSTKGLACNFLTSYSDPDRMRADLYYTDPCFIFDHCKRNLSKNVAILHDYNLYDFTLLVRK